MFFLNACSSETESNHYSDLALNELNYENYLAKKHHLNEQQLLTHLKVLSSDKFAGRKFNNNQNKRSQKYIIEVLKLAKVLPFNQHFKHTFTREKLFQTSKGSNIIGIIKGTVYTDKYIVVSAHYDHLGTKGHKIFNGADDNASGTAALLEMAIKIMDSPLKHSVILLFSDGEEKGLLGANAFIKENKKLHQNILLNINMDMIAGDSSTNKLHYVTKGVSNILALSEYQKFQQLLPVKIKKGFKQTYFQRTVGGNNINWFMASDHGAFNSVSIPFIYFGVGTHKNYHTVDDTFDNINQPFFLSASQAIYAHLRYFDSKLVVKIDKTT